MISSQGGYGVVPTGFNRKGFNSILLEIENAMVTEFGPNVIQTPESPLGQINGLFAYAVTQLWEFAEDVYQSYDVDQAEGNRLDALAVLRLMERGIGESDEIFRSAITNQGRARVDLADITRAVASIDGVTYVHVWVNDSMEMDPNQLPPASLAVAVLGGDDSEVGAAIRRYVVPGIVTHGNIMVSTVFEGYCRSMLIVRPVLVPVKLWLEVKTRPDSMGCPPPSVTAIRNGLIQDLSLGGAKMLLNGDDLDYYRIRSAVESRWSNVEVLSFRGERDSLIFPDGAPVIIDFLEMATLAPEDVLVNSV